MDMRRPTRRCNSIWPDGCGLRTGAWFRWQLDYRRLLSAGLLTQKSPCKWPGAFGMALRCHQRFYAFICLHHVGVRDVWLWWCRASKNIDRKRKRIAWKPKYIDPKPQKIYQKTDHVVRLPRKQFRRNRLSALFVGWWRFWWRLCRTLWFGRRLFRSWLWWRRFFRWRGLRWRLNEEDWLQGNWSLKKIIKQLQRQKLKLKQR